MLLKYTYLLLLLPILLLFGCGNKDEDKLQPSLPGCLQDRATMQVLTDQEGTLESEAGLLLINVSSSGELLAPCNLPNTYQENDRVIFSGNKKEILPNERWAGQPFELTHIRKAE